MKFLMSIPNNLLEMFYVILEGLIYFFRRGWMVIVGVFWISYAVEVGLITELQGSAISQAYLLSVICPIALWSMVSGSYKIVRAVASGDVRHTVSTFDSGDVLIAYTMIIFSLAYILLPRFLMGHHFVLDILILFFTFSILILGVPYAVISLTARRLVHPDKPLN